MSEEETKRLKNVQQMNKRRMEMDDGRRYLIYYSFEMSEPVEEKNEESETINKD